MEQMTEITRKMYESAIRMRTVRDAGKVLRETGVFRTLGDILRSFSGMENPKVLLVDGLVAWNRDICRENLDKKVRNWLGGKTRSISKRDAFVLSRIMKLPMDRTDEFLKMVTGEGIHWRSPEDIVWGYAIHQDLPPERTLALLDRVEAMGKPPKPSADPAALSYTAEVHEKVASVLDGSEEDLMAFLNGQWHQLGVLHNTAYSLFTHYLELLERGYSDSGVEALHEELSREEKRKEEKLARDRLDTAREEAKQAGRAFRPDDPDAKLTIEDMDGDTKLYRPETMTTREVLETYLYRKLVPVVERGEARRAESFSTIQRSIRMSWPDEFGISKMKKRQTDVSRKVLILLFLATDGSDSDYSEEDEDEELLTPDQIFRNIHTRMDLMLHSCGFQKLDPRSPFDWMVLYCICIGDLWEADNRLQEMLKEMFPEETQTEE